MIIGGGCSGVLIAVQLSLKAKGPIKLTVIDRMNRPGGVAYSSAHPSLILNVPAGRMSAFDDDPNHFVQWMRKEGHDIGKSQFAPRSLYGSYLTQLLRSAERVSDYAHVDWIRGDVVSLVLTNGQPCVTLANGTDICADLAVLAIGNAPPPVPPVLEHLAYPGFVAFPWAEGALEGIPAWGKVLVLGTGLTAVDQVLALQAQGFCGQILMLSRRGVLPAVHLLESSAWQIDWTAENCQTLPGLFAAVRKHIRKTEHANWRKVIDAMRPDTPHLWAELSAADRSQFLRHLRPYWDAARHRMPPETFSILDGLSKAGQLEVTAGSITLAESQRDQIAVHYRSRGTSQLSTILVNRIINCIGSAPISSTPLVQMMLKDRLARCDSVGLGIETQTDGAIIPAVGNTHDCLYAIGPVRKASHWETTAVPEIRRQAATLAERLLDRV